MAEKFVDMDLTDKKECGIQLEAIIKENEEEFRKDHLVSANMKVDAAKDKVTDNIELALANTADLEVIFSVITKIRIWRIRLRICWRWLMILMMMLMF